MNKLYYFLAAAVTLGMTLSAPAGDPFLSPRAAQHRYELRKVPVSPKEVNLLTNRPIGNAKAWAMAQSVRKVPSTGPSIDLAHAPRPALSPRDHRFEMAWRENAIKQFEIAPLK